MQTLRALDGQLRAVGGALTVHAGRPEHVVPAVAREVQAQAVHITADFAPYGSGRDQRVAKALGAVPLIATGSPYAAAPGEIVKPDGRPYEVFTPFYRSWLAHGLELPVPFDLASIAWRPLDGLPIAADPGPEGIWPEPGEPAARLAWELFRTTRLATYATARDHPALDATSRLSPYLKVGALHPRTLLADLGPDDDAFRRQLAWREFYAAVLHHWPSTLVRASNRRWKRCGTTTGRPQTVDSQRGRPVALAFPWSTPGCDSCAPKAGCTTGSG